MLQDFLDEIRLFDKADDAHLIFADFAKQRIDLIDFLLLITGCRICFKREVLSARIYRGFDL